MTTGQYQVLRFTPDPVRDEPLNIGLVMTGNFTSIADFPDEALERAARWCRGLDQSGLRALRESLIKLVERALAVSDDIGQVLKPDFLGEAFGPITISEPRWIDVQPANASELFSYLTKRLVLPPKPVSYGGGAPEAKKLAKSILPLVQSRRAEARLDEPLVAMSGRPFMADIFAGGEQPLVISTLVLGSSWQGVRAIEAKAFELFDVGRSLKNPRLGAVCAFPAIDPEGSRRQAELVFKSIDVAVVDRDDSASLAALLV